MTQSTGLGDFDFLLANWQIKNTRRKVFSLYTNPQHNQVAEWEEFSATGGRGTKLFEGKVQLDYFSGIFPDGEAIEGLTIRAFDKITQEWSIGWLDNRQPPDYRPLIGKFRDGVGEFHQVIETPDGKPLHVRFLWDNITDRTARWQQAFSLDGGKTWETNWIMEFTREL
jgi:hypothetical protein